MAKEYILSGDGLTLANAVVTLVGFLPPAAPGPDYQILRMYAGQVTAVPIMQRIQSVTQVTAYPTVVTATPRPVKLGDTAASLLVGVGGALTAGKCGLNASAEGAGAKSVVIPDVFNTNNGYLWVPTPREIICVPAGYASSFGLYLPVAAVPLTGWATGISYGEGSSN